MKHVIRLRGHHLLCILTHSGKGYTEDFNKNLHDKVIMPLNAGALIEIIRGPDAICAGFSEQDKEQGACRHAFSCAKDRLLQIADQRVIRDVLWLLQRTLPANRRLPLDSSEIRWLRRAFAEGVAREHVCQSCQWRDACSEVSRHDFKGALLMPTAKSSRYPFTLSHPPRPAFSQSWSDRKRRRYLTKSLP